MQSIIIRIGVFGAAAGLCLGVALLSVQAVETKWQTAIQQALDEGNMPWAHARMDGLSLTLSGTAPGEIDRLRALSMAGKIIDARYIVDAMQSRALSNIDAPQFSAEILRNDTGLSIIGLIPATTGHDEIGALIKTLARPGIPVTNLIQTANYPPPNDWGDALSYALLAVEILPRSKISVQAGRISITAITDSVTEKRELEQHFKDTAPPNLRLSLNIAAPRPVITPFTLRFVMDDDGARFDACSADTPSAQGQIMQAAAKAGLTSPSTCAIGIGAPSPRWSEASHLAIAALAEIGAGTLTISDTDISVIAGNGVDPTHFDHVIGELELALPHVFSLYAQLPKTVDKTADTPEFIATLSPEGQVQLRGRLSDPSLRLMVDGYAKSHFGSENVYTATRIVEDLPNTWPVRVLSGVQALSKLSNGMMYITPDTVKISGISSHKNAHSEIATLLADKLGKNKPFEIDVTYWEKPPPPVIVKPAPQECVTQINQILRARKIRFEPGSATIDHSALEIIDDIADAIRECDPLELEIQGHTDSQGREIMNQNLSQARAQSVLNALYGRRIRTSGFRAVGYGESSPIAGNDTEEGRETNRRIEFRLIVHKTDRAANDAEDNANLAITTTGEGDQ